MSKWVKYIHRLAYLSSVSKFMYAGSKVIQRFFAYFRKAYAGLHGTMISDAQFKKALLLEFSRNDEFLASFREQRSRRFFVEPQSRQEIIKTLSDICPESAAPIVRAADTICEHSFDLLGSGPTRLSWPIDWHADFKAGFRWDPGQYFAAIRQAPYPGGYDLKVPWELSRCQHFICLGQAYWLTGDEKYSREFRAEMDDWIEQNTPEYGVNWACSMDIAIRAVNWLWGYSFFQSSAIVDDKFRLAFYKSLLSHGRHIRANLERTATFAGNHYLSDIVGLTYLGILLPELKEARSWREFGLRELEREMFKQVYPDGGNFESSTSYHRLVTELFLSATLLARLNGYSFSALYMKRLERMVEFIAQLTKPDGTVPTFGDQDNGRLHRLKVWEQPDQEWKDYRGLLALGCVLFDKQEWGTAAGKQWEEAIWFYGRQALEAFKNSPPLSLLHLQSTEFKDTGIYIMRADDIFVAVDAGPIGQNGKGGHAHNDSLSFELFSSGQTWIQDPGTYLYTADYEARNLFRSTAYHNTLAIPGHEQNGYEAEVLFSLKNESVTQTLSWQVELGADSRLTAEVRRVRSPRVLHRRTFHLCRKNRALLLIDTVLNSSSPCEIFFHFAGGLQAELVEEPYPGIKLINAEGKFAWLFSVSPPGGKFQRSGGWISESYGRRVPAWVASMKVESIFEYKTLFLLPGDADISQRIANVINDEDHDH